MRPFRPAKIALAAVVMFALSALSYAQETTIHDRTIVAGAQTFRYLSAGTEGQPIVLLHGWPQNADEFRKIIPELAKHHAVYAPDLSGIGGTTAPGKNWHKEILARDIKGFVNALGLKEPLVVGHDIGGMIAYAYARQFPKELAGLAILDVPMPGLAPWDEVAKSQHAWHFDFHDQKGLAENLVAGRQAEYFRYFIHQTAANREKISEREIAVYAKAYGSLDQLKAGFELYRAFDDDAAFFKSHNEPFDVPMLVVGGEYSMQATLPVMAKSFAASGATTVRTAAVAGAGHWLANEQPARTAAVLTEFAAEVSGP